MKVFVETRDALAIDGRIGNIAAMTRLRKQSRQISACGLICMAALAAMPGAAQAQHLPPLRGAPFTATLSNTTPLAFGMDAADAARALGTPLAYIQGRPGDEIYLALRDVGGGGLFPRADRLFLQFRHGRLTGWKGDWGRNWMWRSPPA